MTPAWVPTASRRGVLLALGMAALLAVIAACGGGDDGTPTSAAPTATSPAPTATSPSAPGETRVAPTPTATTPPRPAWELEWEETIAAAEQEGTFVVAVGRAAYRNSAEKLSDFFPNIVVESRVGSGLEERILLEQEAGIFGVDVQLTGGPTVIITLVPAGAAGDTRSVLFRPDVIDDENWVGNFDDHWMDDDTRKHTFGYQATQASASFTVNTNLVSGDPQDFQLDSLVAFGGCQRVRDGIRELFDVRYRPPIVLPDPVPAADLAHGRVRHSVNNDNTSRRTLILVGRRCPREFITRRAQRQQRRLQDCLPVGLP